MVVRASLQGFDDSRSADDAVAGWPIPSRRTCDLGANGLAASALPADSSAPRWLFLYPGAAIFVIGPALEPAASARDRSPLPRASRSTSTASSSPASPMLVGRTVPVLRHRRAALCRRRAGFLPAKNPRWSAGAIGSPSSVPLIGAGIVLGDRASPGSSYCVVAWAVGRFLAHSSYPSIFRILVRLQHAGGACPPSRLHRFSSRRSSMQPETKSRARRRQARTASTI